MKSAGTPVELPANSRTGRSPLRMVLRCVNAVSFGLFSVVVTATVGLGVLSWFSHDGTASLLGHEVLIVRSGSMSPAFSTGDAVIIRRMNDRESTALRTGDVVTVRSGSAPGQLVTHRIVAISGDSSSPRMFTLKGDANGEPDPSPVSSDQVVGIVRRSVPRLGYAMHAIQQRQVLFSFGLALVLGWLANAMVRFADSQENNTTTTTGDTQ